MKKLTLKQLKGARLKTLRNAEDLIKEAEILYKNGRFPRIIFLCQIAGEEIGKYFIIGSFIVDFIHKGDINWKKFWKRFLSHHEKLETLAFLENILLGMEPPKKYGEYLKKMHQEICLLEQLKQKSIYTDFTNEKFYYPAEVITKKMASDCLRWAHGRLKLIKAFEKELGLDNIINKIKRKDIEISSRILKDIFKSAKIKI